MDRACRAWISEHNGVAAVSSRADSQHARRSWQDPQGRSDADLDHIIAFPATIPMSHRRLLHKLEPGLDHLPVSVAFQTDTLGEHIEMRQGARHHQPRLQTNDFVEQEPAIRQALQEWEAKRPPMEPGETDADALHDALREAKQVFGQVTGWTKEPQPPRKWVLPGHRRLLRELDVLCVWRRVAQQAMDASVVTGTAAWQEGQLRHWQRWVLRGREVLGSAFPRAAIERSTEFWGVMLDTVRDAVKGRQQ